jgi:hypothetical protein
MILAQHRDGSYRSGEVRKRGGTVGDGEGCTDENGSIPGAMRCYRRVEVGWPSRVWSSGCVVAVAVAVRPGSPTIEAVLTEVAATQMNDYGPSRIGSGRT